VIRAHVTINRYSLLQERLTKGKYPHRKNHIKGHNDQLSAPLKLGKLYIASSEEGPTQPQLCSYLFAVRICPLDWKCLISTPINAPTTNPKNSKKQSEMDLSQ